MEQEKLGGFWGKSDKEERIQKLEEASERLDKRVNETRTYAYHVDMELEEVGNNVQDLKKHLNGFKQFVSSWNAQKYNDYIGLLRRVNDLEEMLKSKGHDVYEYKDRQTKQPEDFYSSSEEEEEMPDYYRSPFDWDEDEEEERRDDGPQRKETLELPENWESTTFDSKMSSKLPKNTKAVVDKYQKPCSRKRSSRASSTRKPTTS